MIVGVPPSDAGATDPHIAAAPKPCAQRLAIGHGWCELNDGHEGPHRGHVSQKPVAANYGPRRSR